MALIKNNYPLRMAWCICRMESGNGRGDRKRDREIVVVFMGAQLLIHSWQKLNYVVVVWLKYGKVQATNSLILPIRLKQRHMPVSSVGRTFSADTDAKRPRPAYLPTNTLLQIAAINNNQKLHLTEVDALQAFAFLCNQFLVGPK